VVDAFMSGLEDRLKKGADLSGVSSVASFFLSRIDIKVDPILDKISSSSGENSEIARDMKGKIAIDSAKLAYKFYNKLYSGKRWQRLEAEGATPQRLLWASTSTKNHEYSDIMYVEALIGPNTVNTLPPATYEAYKDHGSPKSLLELDMDLSESDIKMLSEIGIDLKGITQQLEEEGVQKFIAPYDKLLATLSEKMKEF
jgi:transaldolase